MIKANKHSLGRRLPAEVRDALDGWRQGAGPLYRRFAAAAERQDLLPGTKPAPKRLLAAQLGVAGTTVSAAHELLELRALVHRREGRYGGPT
jgi:DNA-binding transcriptional MocR family regulator